MKNSMKKKIIYNFNLETDLVPIEQIQMLNKKQLKCKNWRDYFTEEELLVNFQKITSGVDPNDSE